MSTTIAAVLRRDWTEGLFDDLEVTVASRVFDRPTQVTTLTFVEDLDDVTVAAIRDRMTSRDDADQAARAALTAARDAVADAAVPATLEDALALIELLRTAVVGGMDYWLRGAS